jgi:segregation and condensation protein B
MTNQHEDDVSGGRKKKVAFNVETSTELAGEQVFSEALPAPQELVSSLDLGESNADLNDEFLMELREEEQIQLAASEEVSDLSLSAASELGQDGAQLNEALGTAEITPLAEELTITGKIEAILFASPRPLRTVEIHELIKDYDYDLKETQDALDEITEYYQNKAGGFHLKYIKRMGYQFQTTSAAKTLMEKQFASRPRPLSRASLETMAVVAYRQKSNKSGVTRAEVEFIRGVDAGSIFKTLVERNLLTCIGRKEIPGRPMMFGVTDEFLKVFQLGSINDLPPLESFQTPSDIIAAANSKIAQFEAEEEGVNPEEFIGDESYTDELGEGNVNVLDATAPLFSPALAEPVISAPVMAELAADTLAEQSAEEKMAAALEAEAVAVPAEVVEAMADDLIEHLHEGDMAFKIEPSVLKDSPEATAVPSTDELSDDAARD